MMGNTAKQNQRERTGRSCNRWVYLVYAYVVAILFFLLFRLINTWVFCSSHDVQMDGLYWRALLKGWQFDTLICSFMLAVPTLMILVGEWCHIRRQGFYAVAHWLIVTLFIVCFFACAADIPYFNYFFTHLNAFAIDWGGDAGIVIGMIVKEPSYILFFFLFLLLSTGYGWLMHRVYRRLLRTRTVVFQNWKQATVTTLVLCLFLFCGMRGKPFGKRPLDTSDATCSSNAFINKIGLNPIFTLIKSVGDQRKMDSQNHLVSLMDPETAQMLATETMGWNTTVAAWDTPILPEGTNVVLVIMESMSTQKVGFLNPQSDLTPCLDTLMRQSLVFSQAYSAGTHTHDGLFSTLYAYPAVLSQNQLMLMPKMCGLPQALLQQGYATWFFVPHDSEYDNMNKFLSQNGFQHIVDQLDYDYDQVAGIWGVPDHVMFDKAIERLAQQDSNQPFFATLLTCSDHGPYVFPKDIELQPRHRDMKEKMVEYADWAIGRFMEKAAQQPWFANTLFVFVADHGASMDHTYDMSLSHHHIPLFYYFPGHITARQNPIPAMQIDVAPTLLAMMPFAWENRTMGIDLNHQQRPYAYFNNDDMVGVVDGREWFWLFRTREQHASLYRYKQNDTRDYIETYQALADSMQTYSLSQIQTTQTLLRSGETQCHLTQ